MAAKIYTAKLCNSIDRYIDTKSTLEIKNEAPIVVNSTIKGYSAILGVEVSPSTALLCVLPSSPWSEPNGFSRGVRTALLVAQGNKMKAPTINKNTSMNCVTVVTWNKPLYNPKPEGVLIACVYKLLKDNAALKSKIIEVIRVNKIGVIVDE